LDLPSLTDIFFIIIFLIPGFVVLSLFRRIAVYDRSLSDKETIYWSLFCSLIIIGIYTWKTNTTNITKLTSEIFLPTNIFLLIGIALTLGLFSGGIIRLTIQKNVFHEDCWELTMRKASENVTWITVYTNDNEEFMGTLHYNSGSTDPREISIRNPIKIIRQNGDIEEKEWGNEILFLEKDIKRIVFLREV